MSDVLALSKPGMLLLTGLDESPGDPHRYCGGSLRSGVCAGQEAGRFDPFAGAGGRNTGAGNIVHHV